MKWFPKSSLLYVLGNNTISIFSVENGRDPVCSYSLNDQIKTPIITFSFVPSSTINIFSLLLESADRSIYYMPLVIPPSYVYSSKEYNEMIYYDVLLNGTCKEFVQENLKQKVIPLQSSNSYIDFLLFLPLKSEEKHVNCVYYMTKLKNYTLPILCIHQGEKTKKLLTTASLVVYFILF